MDFKVKTLRKIISISILILSVSFGINDIEAGQVRISKGDVSLTKPDNWSPPLTPEPSDWIKLGSDSNIFFDKPNSIIKGIDLNNFSLNQITVSEDSVIGSIYNSGETSTPAATSIDILTGKNLTLNGEANEERYINFYPAIENINLEGKNKLHFKSKGDGLLAYQGGISGETNDVEIGIEGNVALSEKLDDIGQIDIKDNSMLEVNSESTIDDGHLHIGENSKIVAVQGMNVFKDMTGKISKSYLDIRGPFLSRTSSTGNFKEINLSTGQASLTLDSTTQLNSVINVTAPNTVINFSKNASGSNILSRFKGSEINTAQLNLNSSTTISTPDIGLMQAINMAPNIVLNLTSPINFIDAVLNLTGPNSIIKANSEDISFRKFSGNLPLSTLGIYKSCSVNDVSFNEIGQINIYLGKTLVIATQADVDSSRIFFADPNGNIMTIVEGVKFNNAFNNRNLSTATLIAEANTEITDPSAGNMKLEIGSNIELINNAPNTVFIQDIDFGNGGILTMLQAGIIAGNSTNTLGSSLNVRNNTIAQNTGLGEALITIDSLKTFISDVENANYSGGLKFLGPNAHFIMQRSGKIGKIEGGQYGNFLTTADSVTLSSNGGGSLQLIEINRTSPEGISELIFDITSGNLNLLTSNSEIRFLSDLARITIYNQGNQQRIVNLEQNLLPSLSGANRFRVMGNIKVTGGSIGSVGNCFLETEFKGLGSTINLDSEIFTKNLLIGQSMIPLGKLTICGTDGCGGGSNADFAGPVNELNMGKDLYFNKINFSENSWFPIAGDNQIEIRDATSTGYGGFDFNHGTGILTINNSIPSQNSNQEPSQLNVHLINAENSRIRIERDTIISQPKSLTIGSLSIERATNLIFNSRDLIYSAKTELFNDSAFIVREPMHIAGVTRGGILKADSDLTLGGDNKFEHIFIGQANLPVTVKFIYENNGEFNNKNITFNDQFSKLMLYYNGEQDGVVYINNDIISREATGSIVIENVNKGVNLNINGIGQIGTEANPFPLVTITGEGNTTIDTDIFSDFIEFGDHEVNPLNNKAIGETVFNGVLHTHNKNLLKFHQNSSGVFFVRDTNINDIDFNNKRATITLATDVNLRVNNLLNGGAGGKLNFGENLAQAGKLIIVPDTDGSSTSNMDVSFINPQNGTLVVGGNSLYINNANLGELGKIIINSDATILSDVPDIDYIGNIDISRNSKFIIRQPARFSGQIEGEGELHINAPTTIIGRNADFKNILIGQSSSPSTLEYIVTDYQTALFSDDSKLLFNNPLSTFKIINNELSTLQVSLTKPLLPTSGKGLVEMVADKRESDLTLNGASIGGNNNYFNSIYIKGNGIVRVNNQIFAKNINIGSEYENENNDLQSLAFNQLENINDLNNLNFYQDVKEINFNQANLYFNEINFNNSRAAIILGDNQNLSVNVINNPGNNGVLNFENGKGRLTILPTVNVQNVMNIDITNAAYATLEVQKDIILTNPNLANIGNIVLAAGKSININLLKPAILNNNIKMLRDSRFVIDNLSIPNPNLLNQIDDEQEITTLSDFSSNNSLRLQLDGNLDFQNENGRLTILKPVIMNGHILQARNATLDISGASILTTNAEISSFGQVNIMRGNLEFDAQNGDIELATNEKSVFNFLDDQSALIFSNSGNENHIINFNNNLANETLRTTSLRINSETNEILVGNTNASLGSIENSWKKVIFTGSGKKQLSANLFAAELILGVADTDNLGAVTLNYINKNAPHSSSLTVNSDCDRLYLSQGINLNNANLNNKFIKITVGENKDFEIKTVNGSSNTHLTLNGNNNLYSGSAISELLKLSMTGNISLPNGDYNINEIEGVIAANMIIPSYFKLNGNKITGNLTLDFDNSNAEINAEIDNINDIEIFKSNVVLSKAIKARNINANQSNFSLNDNVTANNFNIEEGDININKNISIAAPLTINNSKINLKNKILNNIKNLTLYGEIDLHWAPGGYFSLTNDAIVDAQEANIKVSIDTVNGEEVYGKIYPIITGNNIPQQDLKFSIIDSNDQVVWIGSGFSMQAYPANTVLPNLDKELVEGGSGAILNTTNILVGNIEVNDNNTLQHEDDTAILSQNIVAEADEQLAPPVPERAAVIAEVPANVAPVIIQPEIVHVPEIELAAVPHVVDAQLLAPPMPERAAVIAEVPANVAPVIIQPEIVHVPEIELAAVPHVVDAQLLAPPMPEIAPVIAEVPANVAPVIIQPEIVHVPEIELAAVPHVVDAQLLAPPMPEIAPVIADEAAQDAPTAANIRVTEADAPRHVAEQVRLPSDEVASTSNLNNVVTTNRSTNSLKTTKISEKSNVIDGLTIPENNQKELTNQLSVVPSVTNLNPVPPVVNLPFSQDKLQALGDNLIVSLKKLPTSEAVEIVDKIEMMQSVESNAAVDNIINTANLEIIPNVLNDFNNYINFRIHNNYVSNEDSFGGNNNAREKEKLGKAGGDSIENKNNGVWVSPFYVQGKQSLKNNVPGFKVKSGGGMIGMDHIFNDVALAGIALGVIDSKVKYHNKSGDSSNIKSYLTSVYGRQELPQNFYVQGKLSTSFNKISNKGNRGSSNLGYSKFKKKHNGFALNAGTEVGYNKKLSNNAVITPSVGINYGHIQESKYKEKGSNLYNLHVSKNKINKVEAVANLATSINFEHGNNMITPTLTAGIRHDLTGKKTRSTVRVEGADIDFPTKALKPTRTYYNVGASVAINNKENGMSFEAGVSCTKAKKYQFYQATVKLGYNF